MTKDELISQIESLTVWRRRGERAPHKPLLLLLALGEFSRGISAIPYASYETRLLELLREFGPARRSLHPEYPFWRLQQDGLWRVSAAAPMRGRLSNADPPRTELRSKNAVGEFPEAVKRLLSVDADLVVDIAERVLCAHFPETLHEDILCAVGLSGASKSSGRRVRDPRFRDRVLLAYEYRCALCGLDLRMGNVTVGLEAAHIQWHEAGGPDIAENGIALCPLHHKLFDLGAFTVDAKLCAVVSEKVHGGQGFESVLLRHHGRSIYRPSNPENMPGLRFLEWHRRQVFKGNARFVE